ncbi:MAG: hypothetical protein WA440_11940 [Ignavibacteriaceae bacterium]
MKQSILNYQQIKSLTTALDKKGKLIFEAGDGFEGSFRTVAFLWNAGEKDYHKDVFNNLKKFLPRR